MKEGLAINARWFLNATVGERMDAGLHGEDLIGSLLVEMERLERVLPRYKAIVRDLAATNPAVRSANGWTCLLCERETTTLDSHAESCPWRRARELQQGDGE